VGDVDFPEKLLGYAKGGNVKFENGGVVSEWIIETRNESEYFDYEDDARDFGLMKW
jgi:hypothetical protein